MIDQINKQLVYHQGSGHLRKTSLAIRRSGTIRHSFDCLGIIIHEDASDMVTKAQGGKDEFLTRLQTHASHLVKMLMPTI